MIIVSVNFILEALKDEFALLILILSYALFSIYFVLFVVEHMVAKVQYRPFIHLSSLPLYDILNCTLSVGVLIELDKLANSPL
jgi:hypothetical protein